MSTTPMRSRAWMPYLIGAVAALAGSFLWQSLTAPRPAYGQVPDSGAQRNVMIKELQTANRQLREVSGYLKEIRDLQKSDRKPDPHTPPHGDRPRPPRP